MSLANDLFNRSLAWLDEADKANDINSTIAWTGMSEIALAQARFAAEFPAVAMGLDELPPQPGRPAMPSGPIGGPQVWGPQR